MRRRGAVRSELRERAPRQPGESRNEPLVWQEEDPLSASPPPPQHVLVLAPDEPFEVHPPDIVPRPVAERLPRNEELRRPAEGRDAGPRIPHPIPVQVDGLVVDHLGVRYRAVRVHLEQETSAAIAQRVEQQRERVVRPEVGVAAELGMADGARPAVVCPHSDVEAIQCCQEPYNGPLGPRTPLNGVGLREVCNRVGGEPHRLSERPVKSDRRRGMNDAGVPLGILRAHNQRRERADHDYRRAASRHPTHAVPPVIRWSERSPSAPTR